MPTLGEYIKIMTLDAFKLWNFLTLNFYRSWMGKPTTLSSDALAVRQVKKYNQCYVTWSGS